MGKRLIGEKEIQQAAREGQHTLNVPPTECIVTPMARDAADALGITLVAGSEGVSAAGTAAPVPTRASESSDTGRLVEKVVSRLRSQLPAGVSAERLGQVVREVVASRLSVAAEPLTGAAGRAVRFIGRPQTNSPVAVDGSVRLAEVLPAAQGGGLSAGILAWEKASFQRQVDADEIDIVISGQIEITADGKPLQAGPGDMIYLPQGAQVVYRAPSSVMLACVNRA